MTLPLCSAFLQHSSAAVTQRYIGTEPQRIEQDRRARGFTIVHENSGEGYSPDYYLVDTNANPHCVAKTSTLLPGNPKIVRFCVPAKAS